MEVTAALPNKTVEDKVVRMAAALSATGVYATDLEADKAQLRVLRDSCRDGLTSQGVNPPVKAEKYP